MEYTLSYDEGVKGWVSFYSFMPDYMIGMNNYFYSFKGGNLYRHNVNPIRNNFYGVQYPSRVTSVLNDLPLENKLFKTIDLEGDDAWSMTGVTDLQTNSYIDAAWFEKKEQAWFAFIRTSYGVPAPDAEYAMRSVNGIGKSLAITILPPDQAVIDFSISPLVSIGDIISIGDYLYFIDATYTTPTLAGQVENIIVNYPAGLNRLVINTSDPSAVPMTTNDPYLMYIKNSVAESHGMLGHYLLFELENFNVNKVELFAVQSEVMKSYP